MRVIANRDGNHMKKGDIGTVLETVCIDSDDYYIVLLDGWYRVGPSAVSYWTELNSDPKWVRQANFEEALERALLEPSLSAAMSYIAVWENDRSVRQALQNQGTSWETCFGYCFQRVEQAWQEREAAKESA